MYACYRLDIGSFDEHIWIIYPILRYENQNTALKCARKFVYALVKSRLFLI